jgi:maltose-binding protein MalE
MAHSPNEKTLNETRADECMHAIVIILQDNNAQPSIPIMRAIAATAELRLFLLNVLNGMNASEALEDVVASR